MNQAVLHAPQTVEVPADTRDHDAIVAHIRGLFEAFIRGDREAIRRGHTGDWRGFQVGSRTLVRGIDSYMQAAEQALRSARGTRYEFLDMDVRVHGDHAVVFYLARYWVRDDAGAEQPLLLRSVDLYRREAGGWNQCGSNICWAPAETPAAAAPAPVETAAAAALSEADRRELLARREAVWRAWCANDRAALNDLVAADVIAVDAGPQPFADRAEVLRRAADFARGGGRLVKLEFPETRIQLAGAAVIIYTRFVMETESGGESSTLAGRATEVFERRGGRWVNTGWHVDSGQ